MSTFDGYTREFGHRIRIDRFTAPKRSPFNPNAHGPLFYLLSHVHSDHIVGLDSREFEGKVYCTQATKDLLLGTIPVFDRIKAEEGHPLTVKPYSHLADVHESLQAQAKKRRRRLRFLYVVDLNVPFREELGNGKTVTVTAIDANHCPGAVMFLIQSPSAAILYTGDVRSEPCLINALRRNPALAPYLASPPKEEADSRPHFDERRPQRILETIYLDTSCALCLTELLPKAEAVLDIIDLVARFPPDARFFLNCWTLGYEELLKGIAAAFDTKIHFDGYKRSLYQKQGVRELDPVLARIAGTEDCRFHACERKWKCDIIWAEGIGCYEFTDDEVKDFKGPKLKRTRGPSSDPSLVVFVNPVEMSPGKWRAYRSDALKKLEAAKRASEQIPGTASVEWPTFLLVPLARHSTLPELRQLVACFTPRNIHPNTLYPALKGWDYHALPRLFGDFLYDKDDQQLRLDAEKYFIDTNGQAPSNGTEIPPMVLGQISLENLDGKEADKGIVRFWRETYSIDASDRANPSRTSRTRQLDNLEAARHPRRNVRALSVKREDADHEEGQTASRKRLVKREGRRWLAICQTRFPPGDLHVARGNQLPNEETGAILRPKKTIKTEIHS